MAEEKSIKKREPKVTIDSRFLKVVAVKKDEVKDSLVFVCLDEDKYGHLHKGQLRKLIKDLEQFAPDSCWFGLTKRYQIGIIDRDQLKNKNLLITIGYEDPDVVDKHLVEEQWKKAIPEAASITFAHEYGIVEVK